MHGSVVTALAECASSYGAVLNLPTGHSTTTLELKANFLAPGSGRTLRAEATPLHLGRSVSVWRAVVLRNGQPVADVTQTQIVAEDDAAAVNGASDVVVRSEEREYRADRRGTVSGKFSPEIVDERWRQILDGASRVIAAKGFAKATIREIAAAAEMPVPTMYQYLERKEDILYNIYKFFMTDIVTALEHCRSGAPPLRAPGRRDPHDDRRLRQEPSLHQADVPGDARPDAGGPAPGLRARRAVHRGLP